MLLFYLAILLILIGLFVVFLVTESVRVRTKNGERQAFISRERLQVNEKRTASALSKKSEVEQLHHSSDIPDTEGAGDGFQTEAAQECLAEPLDDLRPLEAEESTGDGVYSVTTTLYEDRDGVVAFTSSVETIDVDRFNSLRRIASGALVLAADNLLFRSDETMYRFDFARIRKISGDRNAILVYPDTLSYPLLFLGTGDDMLANRVIQIYSDYTGRK